MEKKKILAIDDNAVNLAAIEQALQDDYEIVLLTSGRRALKYLNVERPNLILLDVRMPEMDGIQTLEAIREMDGGAELPVIFLTAANDPQTMSEGARLKIIDYITKPFDKTELRIRIASVLEKMG